MFTFGYVCVSLSSDITGLILGQRKRLSCQVAAPQKKKERKKKQISKMISAVDLVLSNR